MTPSNEGSSPDIDRCSNRPLPETNNWNPRDASDTLSSGLAKECKGAEERLLQALQHEKAFAVDNFESGLPFEGMIRHEISKLLPQRYAVTSGNVLDRDGRSAGNCDVVIFNNVWFSPVKSAATQDAGKPYLPVEGVYAVGEVKQTLSSATLDEAMEKLVKCHRLNRPRTFAHRVVENREGPTCPHGLTNPLFSFVLAGAVSQDESFTSLINRFFDISKQLKRLEVVRALCVLGEGAVVWSFHDPLNSDEMKPALFVEADLFHPIFPVFSPASFRSPFLLLLQVLHQSLFHVILGPEDVAFAYGLDATGIKRPTDPAVALPVEKEWLDLLNAPCRYDNGRG